MTGLSLHLARTHEALYPRLEALARQVEAIAARRPDADVPAETRAAAEALLFDAMRFSRARKALPAAPDSFAALATVLGQALASLAGFETRHSVWSEAHQGFAWRLARGELVPVQRLRPHAPVERQVGADRQADRLRAELTRRIAAKYDEGFDAGLRAAGREVAGA